MHFDWIVAKYQGERYQAHLGILLSIRSRGVHLFLEILSSVNNYFIGRSLGVYHLWYAIFVY